MLHRIDSLARLFCFRSGFSFGMLHRVDSSHISNLLFEMLFLFDRDNLDFFFFGFGLTLRSGGYRSVW